MAAKAKTKETEDKPWDEIGIGDQVKHAQWGVGTVLFRSGVGDTAKAIVVFPEEGQKKLMLKYAKLKKVGSAPKSEVAAKIQAATAEKAPRPAPTEDDFEEPPAMAGEEDEELPVPEDEEADIFEDDEEEQFDSKGGRGDE